MVYGRQVAVGGGARLPLLVPHRSSCATTASSPSRCRASWRGSRGWTASSRSACPSIYVTDIVLVAALGFLLCAPPGRAAAALHLAPGRLLPAAADPGRSRSSGVLMRYFVQGGHHGGQGAGHRPGDASARPCPTGIGPLFFVHLFLVCVLLAYFPFSKLLHWPGVFLCPTRNLANDSRMRATSTRGTRRSSGTPTRSGRTSSTTRWWPRLPPRRGVRDGGTRQREELVQID